MSNSKEMIGGGDAKQQHRQWLQDYERWHREHRETLTKLAAIQTALLQREAALEDELRQLKGHQEELDEYELLGVEQFGPTPDEMIAKHSALGKKHERISHTHAQTKRLHQKIAELVQELHQLCTNRKDASENPAT